MLDTNIISVLAREPQGLWQAHCKGSADAIGVTVVTAAELHNGCAKKISRKLTAQIEKFLGALKILALARKVDKKTIYGEIGYLSTALKVREGLFL